MDGILAAEAFLNATATHVTNEIMNATSSLHILHNTTCEDLRQADLEQQRLRLLDAARLSAESWAAYSSSIASLSILLDIVFILLIVSLRRHRPIQRAGAGFLCCMLGGCIFGHIASLMDLAYGNEEFRGSICRGKLAVIYLFLYGLLAPLVGKLVSLCRAAQNVLLAGHTAGWDRSAQRFTAGLLAVQLVLIFFYLTLTAGKTVRADRLQTVCSEAVSEHAFHAIDGMQTVLLLVAALSMIGWLQMSSMSAGDGMNEKRGVKDILLSVIVRPLLSIHRPLGCPQLGCPFPSHPCHALLAPLLLRLALLGSCLLTQRSGPIDTALRRSSASAPHVSYSSSSPQHKT